MAVDALNVTQMSDSDQKSKQSRSSGQEAISSSSAAPSFFSEPFSGVVGGEVNVVATKSPQEKGISLLVD